MLQYIKFMKNKQFMIKAISLMSVLILVSVNIVPNTTLAVENENESIPHVAQQENQVSLSNDSSMQEQSRALTNEDVDSWMPDKIVQKGVAKTLGIAVSELTKEKVSELGTQTEFNQLDISGAASLQGLEYATGSTSFAIVARNGTISDLTPLSGVTFSILNIVNNNVSDLSPLTGKALRSFDAADNEISDLSALNFDEMWQFNIDNNHVSNISSIPTTVAMVLARNQTILNLPVSKTNPFSLDTVATVINYNFKNDNFSNISNSGEFFEGSNINKGKVSWDNLDNSVSQVTYEFDRQYNFLQDSSKPNKVYFSGKVIQPFSSEATAGDVTAKYIDTDGKPISDDVILSGNIGEDYST
ncbi:internalin G, partial (plasmid) [Enterococcus faecalis E1Sol]|uniref:MucBP domain-containing protein n=1 Tax=Enterococcus faecalis TaxID=1351 RepID=UPI0001B2E4AC